MKNTTHSKEKLHQDTNQVKSSLESLGGDISQLGESAKNAVHETGEKVADITREKYQETKLQAEDLKESAILKVQEKPLQSLAIAFGIGWLISKIIK